MFGLILICSILSNRPTQLRRGKNDYRTGKSGTVCDICLMIVDAVEVALLSTTDIDEIIDLILPLCDDLTFPLSSICEDFVKTMVPDICDLLERGLEALDICKKIGFCPTSSFQKLDQSKKRKLLKTSIQNKKISDGPLCQVCLDLLELIEKILESETEVDKIIADLLPYCDNLTAPLQILCVNIVKTYVPEFIALLEQEIEHIDICKQFQFCAIHTNSKRSSKYPIRTRMNFGFRDDFICDMCLDLVQVIETTLDSGAEADAIEALVLPYCDTYSWPVSDICRSAIKQFVPEILEDLDQEIEHYEICQKLNLCQATKFNRKPLLEAKKKGFHKNSFFSRF